MIQLQHCAGFAEFAEQYSEVTPGLLDRARTYLVSSDRLNTAHMRVMVAAAWLASVAQRPGIPAAVARDAEHVERALRSFVDDSLRAEQRGDEAQRRVCLAKGYGGEVAVVSMLVLAHAIAGEGALTSINGPMRAVRIIVDAYAAETDDVGDWAAFNAGVCRAASAAVDLASDDGEPSETPRESLN